MAQKNYHLGLHVNKSTILYMLTTYDTNVYQIMLSSPTSYADGKQYDVKTLNSIKSLILKKNVKLFVHGKYLYNFCRPDDRGVKALINEIKMANELNAPLIIHQGKNVNKIPIDDAIKLYTFQLSQVLPHVTENNYLVLENSARQGTEIGYDLDTLEKIYKSFSDDDRKKIKFCIDTCHIFVSGVLSFMDEDEIDIFFNDFERKIGLNNLVAVHLNDSMKPCNSCNDHHEAIGVGHIPYHGLLYFSKMCAKHNIPMILETPNTISYEEQLTKIISYLDS